MIYQKDPETKPSLNKNSCSVTKTKQLVNQLQTSKNKNYCTTGYKSAIFLY